MFNKTIEINLGTATLVVAALSVVIAHYKYEADFNRTMLEGWKALHEGERELHQNMQNLGK